MSSVPMYGHMKKISTRMFNLEWQNTVYTMWLKIISFTHGNSPSNDYLSTNSNANLQ